MQLVDICLSYHNNKNLACCDVSDIRCHDVSDIRCHDVSDIRCHDVSDIRCNDVGDIRCHAISITLHVSRESDADSGSKPIIAQSAVDMHDMRTIAEFRREYGTVNSIDS